MCACVRVLACVRVFKKPTEPLRVLCWLKTHTHSLSASSPTHSHCHLCTFSWLQLLPLISDVSDIFCCLIVQNPSLLQKFISKSAALFSANMGIFFQK